MITLPITKFEIVARGDFKSVYYEEQYAGPGEDGTVDLLAEMFGRAAYNYILPQGHNLKFGTLKGKITTPMLILFAQGNSVLSQLWARDIGSPGPVDFNIPNNCTSIWVSYVVAPNIPLEIELRPHAAMDVTRYVESWPELEIGHQRDGTTGVLTDVSFPVSLVDKGREFVRDLFEQYGLHAKATFNIYKRGDHDDHYTLVKSMELNFESYKEYDNKVEIEGVNGELTEIFGSIGKTKYDIKVNDLSPKTWKYNRMELLNMGNYTIGEGNRGFVSPDYYEGAWTTLISASINSPEIVPGSPEHDMKGQSWESVNSSQISQYFFKAAADTNLWLRLKGEFRVEFKGPKLNSDLPDRCKLVLFKNNEWFEAWDLNQMVERDDSDTFLKRVVYKSSVDRYMKMGIGAGDVLRLGFYFEERTFHTGIEAEVWIEKFDAMSIEYMAQSVDETRSLKIDVVKPETLLQKYLDLMSEKPGYYTGRIDWDGKINPMICAAESIRNFDEAYLHGSAIDFVDWMQVLGYEHSIEDRVITFAPRDTFFRRDVTALELKKNEMADLIVQVNNKHAYTAVRIGYDKQEYDKVNGRFEPNGTFEYTTGYIAKQENVMKWISPYRGDSMGIELLCQERNKKATDKKSDNDVFFVDMEGDLVDGCYKEYRGMVASARATIVEPTEAANPDFDSFVKTFNARVNPYYLVKYNESLIGVNAKELIFTATDMNKEAELMERNEVGDLLPGDDMRSNQLITKRLYDPLEYNFAAGSWQELPLPEVRNGLVHFVWQGRKYKGFIYDIRKNYAQETETTWKLHAVLD